MLKKYGNIEVDENNFDKYNIDCILSKTKNKSLLDFCDECKCNCCSYNKKLMETESNDSNVTFITE